MTYLTAPSAAAVEIAQALGLPKETRGFSLKVAIGEVATVEATILAKDVNTGDLITVLKRFRLEELGDPNAIAQGREHSERPAGAEG